MEIDIIGLISACSYALDCIEAELVNIKNKHGKRVAYISVRMGQFFDLPEDVRDWAAFHHEKLNGKGYPFGKTAAELNEPERIMACIDIYQALTESRPYKQGFSHEKTCDILDDMADKGFIDAGIAQKIRVCFQNTTI